MTVAQNKAALLAMFKPTTKTIDLPNDAGSVMLRELTVEQTDVVREQLKKDKAAAGDNSEDSGATDNFGERILVMSVVDESGDRILDDVDLVEMKKSANGVVEHLIRAALVLNGFQKAPAEKNSVTTPTADSVSA